MARSSRRYSKIIKRFLFSYSTIIILPLLVGLISYWESSRIISDYTKTTHLSMLQQSMTVMDNMITEIDKVTYQLAVTPQIIEFCYLTNYNVNDPSDKSIYYNMQKTFSYVKPYSAYENYGIKYNLYFSKSNKVFNQDGVFSLPEYYKLFGYKDIDEEDFMSNYLWTFNKGSFLPSRTARLTQITTTRNKVSEYNVITYLRSMPLMSNVSVNAMIFVQISEASVQNLLSGLKASNDSSIYIVDEKSNIITSISGQAGDISLQEIEFIGGEGFVEKNMNGKNMYIAYTVSSNNGWKYISAVPTNIVMAKVNSLRTFILGITVVSLSAGIILLIMFSYTNSKPIIELKRTLLDFFNSEADNKTRDDNKTDEFDFLKTSISDLIHQSSTMKSDIQKQLSTLQKSVIERLLFSKNITSKIPEWVTQSGIELSAKAYACVLISIKNLQMENIQLQDLKMWQIVHMEAGHKSYIIDINPTTLCLLLCFGTQDEEECRQHTEAVISWICDQIHKTSNIAPTFTIGSLYHELGDIYHSFNEARQALDFMPVQAQTSVLWYSSLDIDTKSSYYYPIEVEQRLIHLVKHGYKADVSELLSTILRKNMENTTLLYKSQELLRHELIGTVCKLNIENSEDVIARMDSCESLTDVFKYLQELFNNLCDLVNGPKNNHSINLVKEITAYLEANYYDSNLCLSQVAVKFNLSEGYISQLFKEHKGEYLIVYLEQIRLNHACKLLAESNFTINEVASQIGYNSPQSFRRAFKRVKGFNPSDYSEMAGGAPTA